MPSLMAANSPEPILDEWSSHLRQCGWETRAPRIDPAEVQLGEVEGLSVWTPSGMEAPRLCLVGLWGSRLEAPHRPFSRYLDCPRQIRAILRELRKAGRLDFCLICDERFEYWYDAANDRTLGDDARGRKSRAAAQLRKKIWPRLPLDKALEGELEEALKRPVQTLGDELLSWSVLWVNELGSAAEALEALPDPPDKTAVKRLFLLLALSLKVLARPDGFDSIHAACDRVISAPEDELAETGLAGMFEAFATLEAAFPGRLTRHAASSFDWLKRLARARPELVGRLMGELPAISASKCATDALVEAMGDPRVEMNAWRQSVTTRTEDFAKSLLVEGRTVRQPILVDLDRQGLAWLLRCARWAARYWRQRIEAEWERDDDDMVWQLDFTMPWPVAVDENGAIENVLLYALGNSLRIRTEKSLFRMIAELVLFCLALEETSEEPEALPLPLDLSPLWM